MKHICKWDGPKRAIKSESLIILGLHKVRCTPPPTFRFAFECLSLPCREAEL
jgi:hypothetical protein